MKQGVECGMQSWGLQFQVVCLEEDSQRRRGLSKDMMEVRVGEQSR